MRTKNQKVIEKVKRSGRPLEELRERNPYRIIRGLDKIAFMFSCSEKQILKWIDHYGFPASRVEGEGGKKEGELSWYVVQIDAIRWLRVWRVSSFLDLTMQKMEPPEIRRRIMRMREREREAELEPGRRRAREEAETDE